MNITQETNEVYKSDFIIYMDGRFKESGWDNLEDKLKATPNRGIKRLKWSFSIDWNKVFKRGWLLWK